MTPSPTPHVSDTAASENVPVNIAPPNWQCPHCLTKYRTDHDAASRCAAAGPAADIVEGTPVLVLPGERIFGHSRGDGSVLLGRTTVGPVKPVETDGRLEHRRLVLVAGTKVDPDRVAQAPQGHGNLRILTAPGRTGSTEDLSIPLSSNTVLSKLFLGKDTYADFRYTTSPVPVWLDGYYSRRRDGVTWWQAPNVEQRAALNTVLNGALDTIAETDLDKLAEAIAGTYTPNRRTRRSSLRPEDFANANSGLEIARSHGSPNRVWAMRWLAAHLDQVTTWQAQTLHQWAAGTTGNAPAIPAVTYLPIPEALPRNPGKRRLAVMDPFGDTYDSVRDTITAQLALESEPSNPVPDVANVETTIRDLAGREPATNPRGN